MELSAPGEFIIVPRGWWHTALTAESPRLLFINLGERTQNRPA